MKKKSKIGRPPKPKREKYLNPVRQVGRWPEEEWELVKQAAESEGTHVATLCKRLIKDGVHKILRKRKA